MSNAKSRGKPQNDRFQSVRSQLERQTASLLAERRALEGNFDQRPEGRPNIRQVFTESATLTPIVNREDNSQKTQDVINKLQQIIRLCKEEGSLSNEEMREIVKVENEVLNYLQRTSADAEVKISKPAEDTPQAGREKLPPNHTWGKPQTQAFERPLSNEDTLLMIAELQRKALSEIIHLQKERDSLKLQRDQLAEQLSKIHSHGSKVGFGEGERVREQNRLLREENNALNVRLSTLNFGAPTIHKPEYGEDFIKEGLSGQQYNSQIAVYENELKRATVVINELRARLSNVAGLEQLHEQGERIRRQTAELLQYKSRNAHGEDSSVIHELQERLEEEERGKAHFLEELKVFKQHFIELEQENQQLKRQLSGGPSQPASYSPPEGRAPVRGSAKKRSGFSDYEKTLNDMRQVMR